mmetsp:Transcript_93007/g.139605  ORF Transcript_93007/g.139605 Transcript_93007/m.139605 type:complete len:216 (+) Transcript_93007:34-681(+)
MLTSRITFSRVVRGAEALPLALGGAGHHQAHDEAVQAQGLSEDEDQDHTHEQARLLRIRTDACVAHDANRKACCQGAHADREASTQVSVAGIGRVGGGLHLAIDDDGRDQAVDAKHAGHDHWDDAAHDHVRAHDTHGGNAHAGLGGAVGRAEVREDDGRGHAHEAEEGGGGVAGLQLQERGGGVGGHLSGRGAPGQGVCGPRGGGAGKPAEPKEP